MMLYLKNHFITLFCIACLHCLSFAYANESTIFNARGVSIQILDIADTQALVSLALDLQGTPYKLGGTAPDIGFDCSGFVQYVYQNAANITLPRTAFSMSQIGDQLSKDEIAAGDLIFFNTLNQPFSHVAIYLGNDEFIHAPRSGRTVSIDNIKQSYWAKRFNGARRAIN